MYTFKNTEINNKKASEFETKSLLYLIGIRRDRNEIEILAIDCFNDITGSNENFSKLWDVQSKNHSSLPPSKIGISLFTLYDNFISNINFFEYILFIPKLKREYLENQSLNTYQYDNIEKGTRKRIEKKLKSEIARVNNDFTDPPTLFYDFLEKIVFVEDTKKISRYIKNIAKFKNKKIISDKFYESIFVEIRDLQSGLKNSYIENEVISSPIEVLKFNRHIETKEIHTLLISRLVGVDIFSFRAIPISFLPIIQGMNTEGIKDLIQECNENLSRAFFNKNDCRNFWKISEYLITYIRNDSNTDIQDIYISLQGSVKIKSKYLTENTILYMISLIKTGLEYDN